MIDSFTRKTLPTNLKSQNLKFSSGANRNHGVEMVKHKSKVLPPRMSKSPAQSQLIEVRDPLQTTAQQLGSLVKSARDIMRKDKGLNGDLDRLPMLTWIMFLKFLDDMEAIRQKGAILSGEKFIPVIEPPYRWRDWAAKENGVTGEELISFVNNEECTRPNGTKGPGLFAYLRSLQGSNGGDRRDVVATVFKGTVNRMINGYLLRDVINKINGIHFNSSEEIHTFGRLYESMLKEMRDAAGDSGEFYTPRAVVRFMVEVTNPQLGEVVLDPACGTGGFLVESYQYLAKQANTAEKRKILQKSSIIGGEAKPLPYLLAQMNLLLHGLEFPRISPGNSLEVKLSNLGEKDRVDVVLTNPPFGGEEERGIQNNFPADKQSSETALLFLQLIMRKLHKVPKPGRAAVVVPNGTLFGDGVCARIKEELVREFNLHTIVRLPPGVFAPYASIPTNIIFFDRTGPTKDIWYYEQPLPKGRKNYTKTQPIQFEEFSNCVRWWHNRIETEKSWKVSVESIVSDGFNLDRRNPYAEAVVHRPLRGIVGKYQAIQEDIRRKVEKISSTLSAPLRSTKDSTRQLFYSHIDILVREGGGCQRLRDLVLDLAMRGKLVQQNQHDGDSAALLIDLQTKRFGEKQRENHTICKVTEAEMPYKVASSWCWVRIRDVARVVGGGTPKTSRSEFFAENGIPWLTPADLYKLNGKYVSRGRRDISELGLKDSSARLLPKGTVLFSSRAPIGYTAIAANELATNQGFKSCVPYRFDMSEFIYYFLRSSSKRIDAAASGTTFREVSGKEVENILLPLPPLAEQLRIVKRLDETLEQIDDLEGTLKESDGEVSQLSAALFHTLEKESIS